MPAAEVPELDPTESKVFNALSIAISVLGFVGVVVGNVTGRWAVVALVVPLTFGGVIGFHAWIAHRHGIELRSLMAATSRRVFRRKS